MKLKTALLSLVIVAVIAAIYVIASQKQTTTGAEKSATEPIDIVYSDNNGSLPPNLARVRTVDIARDASGAISGSFEVKNGNGSVVENQKLAISSETLAEIIAAAKSLSFGEPNSACIGGGGKELTLNIGTSTESAFSINCPETLNPSLETFYSERIAPLISQFPAK